MINRDFSQSVNGMQTICATISTWMFSTATLHVPDSDIILFCTHTSIHVIFAVLLTVQTTKETLILTNYIQNYHQRMI